jgi:transposase
MDNLKVHKMKRVKDLIEGAGAEVLFLPPYCADFSPIEEAFWKVKGIILRRGSGPAPVKPCWRLPPKRSTR